MDLLALFVFVLIAALFGIMGHWIFYYVLMSLIVLSWMAYGHIFLMPPPFVGILVDLVYSAMFALLVNDLSNEIYKALLMKRPQ